MADGNNTQTPRNSKRIIALAALAGILTGAVAVYVMERPSGNILAGTNPSDRCDMKTDAAKKVDAAATGAIAAMRGADKPQSMSSLSFTGPDGKPTRLEDFKGKTILVNLWATWCVPCREEMPALDALETKKGGDKFQVVTVNVEAGDDTKPKKFLDDIGVKSLKLYRDPSMGVFNDLKQKGLLFGLPLTMLVDQDGCQIAAMNGPADWASQDAERFVDAAVAM